MPTPHAASHPTRRLALILQHPSCCLPTRRGDGGVQEVAQRATAFATGPELDRVPKSNRQRCSPEAIPFLSIITMQSHGWRAAAKMLSGSASKLV